jgi:Ca-activated chloride channel family protein
MIEFREPWFLLLLLVVPVLLRAWWNQRRAALRFPSVGLFSGLPEGRSRWAMRGGYWLRAAGLALLVLALSGPRLPDWGSRLPAEGIAIAMVLDVSGSMAAPDFEWDGEPISRLDAAKRAFHLFVEGGEAPGGVQLPARTNDLIGLVAFGTSPESVCPLTLSHSVLLKMLDEQKVRETGEAETNISDALALALLRLEHARVKRKVVVLLSDGEHNVPTPQSEWKPRHAAQIAASLSIPIYCIDAGSDVNPMDDPLAMTHDPELRAKIRESARNTLRAVAQVSKGRYFQAHDMPTFLAACQEIDRLEKDAIETFRYARHFEGYIWLGAASLACFLCLHFLELTWWLRIP